jgi:hypothetical protein
VTLIVVRAGHRGATALAVRAFIILRTSIVIVARGALRFVHRCTASACGGVACPGAFALVVASANHRVSCNTLSIFTTVTLRACIVVIARGAIWCASLWYALMVAVANVNRARVVVTIA